MERQASYSLHYKLLQLDAVKDRKIWVCKICRFSEFSNSVAFLGNFMRTTNFLSVKLISSKISTFLLSFTIN